MKNENLISSNISWKKHPSNQRYYYIKKNGEVILLRINNFPDEPIYTLINGIDITDIEDRPIGWDLE